MIMTKKAEAMQFIPTNNAGGRNKCSTEKVGLSRLLLYETQH